MASAAGADAAASPTLVVELGAARFDQPARYFIYLQLSLPGGRQPEPQRTEVAETPAEEIVYEQRSFRFGVPAGAAPDDFAQAALTLQAIVVEPSAPDGAKVAATGSLRLASLITPLLQTGEVSHTLELEGGADGEKERVGQRVGSVAVRLRLLRDAAAASAPGTPAVASAANPPPGSAAPQVSQAVGGLGALAPIGGSVRPPSVPPLPASAQPPGSAASLPGSTAAVPPPGSAAAAGTPAAKLDAPVGTPMVAGAAEVVSFEDSKETTHLRRVVEQLQTQLSSRAREVRATFLIWQPPSSPRRPPS